MIDRFWVFHCAYVNVLRRAIIDDHSWGRMRMPFLCGVAEHREHGPILFDAPYGHEGPANLGLLIGTVMKRTALVFDERWSVVPRIEEIGYRASDVGHILMTHLHYDHTGGMKTLAHATFHLSRDEWDWANDGSARRASGRGYAREDFASLKHRLELYEGIPHIAETSEGLDLFGDGSVEMLSLPGHSAGHCGYRIHLADGRTVFFAGDAAFTVAQLRGEEGLGFFPRAVASSITGARTSLRAMDRHLREHPEDLLITSHDPLLGARSIDKGPFLV